MPIDRAKDLLPKMHQELPLLPFELPLFSNLYELFFMPAPLDLAISSCCSPCHLMDISSFASSLALGLVDFFLIGLPLRSISIRQYILTMSSNNQLFLVYDWRNKSRRSDDVLLPKTTACTIWLLELHWHTTWSIHLLSCSFHLNLRAQFKSCAHRPLFLPICWRQRQSNRKPDCFCDLNKISKYSFYQTSSQAVEQSRGQID